MKLEPTDFALEVAAMSELIESLPGEVALRFVAQLSRVVVAAHIQLEDYHKKNVALNHFLVDSLEDVVLDINYTEFDLEATRRERDELRCKLTSEEEP